MSTNLVEILRKTLAAMESKNEFRHDEPALSDLRRSVTLTMGELEIARATRVSRQNGDAQRDSNFNEKALHDNVLYLEERVQTLRAQLTKPQRMEWGREQIEAELRVAELVLSQYRTRECDLERIEN